MLHRGQSWTLQASKIAIVTNIVAAGVLDLSLPCLNKLNELNKTSFNTFCQGSLPGLGVTLTQ